MTSRCPAAHCLFLAVVVVVILTLPQSADDDFSGTELFSFPPSDAELESSSGSGAFGSWQLSPVVTNEYGLEDSDRLHGGEIRPLTSKGVFAPWRPRFVLISALDGTVQLVESKSEIPLWSFSSGPAIYSSYQATSDQRKYFIDIGEDMLPMHEGTVKIIYAGNGEIIDCVPLAEDIVTEIPEFIQNLGSESNSDGLNANAFHTWHQYGECPEGTVPRLRMPDTDEDFFRSMKRLPRSITRNVIQADHDPIDAHEYAIVYTEYGAYYGGAAHISV